MALKMMVVKLGLEFGSPGMSPMILKTTVTRVSGQEG